MAPTWPPSTRDYDVLGSNMCTLALAVVCMSRCPVGTSESMPVLYMSWVVGAAFIGNGTTGTVALAWQ